MQLNIEKLDKMGYTIMKIFAALLLLSCFASCVSSKTHLNKALRKDRAFVIDSLRTLAPCITVKQDTVTLPGEVLPGREDTLYRFIDIEAECPPDKEGKRVVIKVPCKETSYLRVDTVTKRMFITTRIADKGDSILAAITIANQNKEIAKQTNKKDFWMIFSIVLGIILTITLVGKAIMRSLPGSPKT